MRINRIIYAFRYDILYLRLYRFAKEWQKIKRRIKRLKAVISDLPVKRPNNGLYIFRKIYILKSRLILTLTPTLTISYVTR